MARTSEVDPECEAAGSASQGVALPVSMSAPTTVGAMAGSPVCFLPHQYQILWLWYLPNREKPPRRPRQRGRHRPPPRGISEIICRRAGFSTGKTLPSSGKSSELRNLDYD